MASPEENASSGVFICRRCGNCCRRSGEVVVSPEEAEKIAAFLGIGAETFFDRYVAISSDRRQLILAQDAGTPCRFLEESAGGACCRIEPVKPRQCRDFPIHWNEPGWQKECAGCVK
ncbi:MAG: YkgJ family cysteine cluster protein [Victivallaceae bacterium]|nr:YkgJ family cysteine cluster protein [Victivallaceae bacterium]